MKTELLPGGLWPVMLTPFKKDRAIDYTSLEDLIEFYLDGGSSGLFANCLSSEMYHLAPEERIDLVKFVLRRVNGRVPVIATGTFGMNLEVHIQSIQQFHELGLAAVILVTSQVARSSENDEMLKNKIDRILSGTSTIPLGLYECPEPYKRMIPPDLLAYFASTGRFLYYKETSCDSEVIKNKLTSLAGSPLGLYNANTPTALDSLLEGARGLSTISANFYPEMYFILCQAVKNASSSAETVRLQQHLSIMDAVTRIKYPLSAKLFLKMRGLKLEMHTRINIPPLSFEEKKMLEALFEHFNRIKEEFKFLANV